MISSGGLRRNTRHSDWDEQKNKDCSERRKRDRQTGIRERTDNMSILIKKMETDEEIKGKAYVHWRSWHEAYPEIVSREYLSRLTLEKCEKMAFSRPENTMVAKENDRVIGFVCYGDRGEEAPDAGEIFALYVLADYYGKGVGRQLMDAGLEQIRHYPQVHLWVLKENTRAIRFYKKCGFLPDGTEMTSPNISAEEIRMTLRR